MPLMIKGKTACAISGKIISEGDTFLCFPQFPCEPHDPAVVCHDACVLRDEFEKWEFRNNVIEKVKEFWSLDYRMATAFTVVFEDNDYLFVKSKVEEKVRILFLQRVFIIDIPKVFWREFCEMLLSDLDSVRIAPYSSTTLSFNKRAGKVEICLYTQSSGRDCIELSWLEWSHFRSIVTTCGNLFD